jgi:hypothetical protein
MVSSRQFLSVFVDLRVVIGHIFQSLVSLQWSGMPVGVQCRQVKPCFSLAQIQAA